jgi:hypothetical protein
MIDSSSFGFSIKTNTHIERIFSAADMPLIIHTTIDLPLLNLVQMLTFFKCQMQNNSEFTEQISLEQ